MARWRSAPWSRRVIVATSGGSGSGGGTTEALRRPAGPGARGQGRAAPKPKAKRRPAKPTGPTLHGAAPDFSPAKDVKAGVGGGKAVGRKRVDGDDRRRARRTAAPRQRSADRSAARRRRRRGGLDARRSARRRRRAPRPTRQAADLRRDRQQRRRARRKGRLTAPGVVGPAGAESGEADGAPVRRSVRRLRDRRRRRQGPQRVPPHLTKQLSQALLQRPPRQPAAVKVPQAKVVNVVAGPSKDGVYPVSVSLLRVGVTSELRLEHGTGRRQEVASHQRPRLMTHRSPQAPRARRGRHRHRRARPADRRRRGGGKRRSRSAGATLASRPVRHGSAGDPATEAATRAKRSRTPKATARRGDDDGVTENSPLAPEGEAVRHPKLPPASGGTTAKPKANSRPRAKKNSKERKRNRKPTKRPNGSRAEARRQSGAGAADPGAQRLRLRGRRRAAGS